MAQHFLDHGVFVCSRDVLNDVADSVGLGPVQVLDMSSDLDEGFAAGVFCPFVFTCIRVRLTRGPGYDDIYAFRQGLHGGWADAVSVEGEAAIPTDEG